jgi:hypothetical protein
MFLMVLEFELRDSYMLDRHSTSWVIPLSLFALDIFEIGLTYALMTGVCHHPQVFSIEIRVSWTFFGGGSGWPLTMILLISDFQIVKILSKWYPAIGWDRVSQAPCSGWPGTVVLPISAFQVAGITGISHWHLAPPSLSLCSFPIKETNFISNLPFISHEIFSEEMIKHGSEMWWGIFWPSKLERIL